MKFLSSTVYVRCNEIVLSYVTSSLLHFLISFFSPFFQVPRFGHNIWRHFLLGVKLWFGGIELWL
jgi:hypothetical protein